MVDAKRELEITAALDAAIDDLTKLGPRTSARAFAWAFSRYGIDPTCAIRPGDITDRRPPKPAPEPAPVAEPTPIIDLLAIARETVACPICNKNGFKDRRGLGGHMWQTHHVRATEYKPVEEEHIT